MADLSSLIERLRAATGPERELDAAICLALGVPGKRVEIYKRNVYPRQWTGFKTEYPKLTASIDAAVALCKRLLPGSDWQTGTYGGAATAYIEPQKGSGPSAHCSEAATPAIALCIGILTALQAKEPAP